MKISDKLLAAGIDVKNIKNKKEFKALLKQADHDLEQLTGDVIDSLASLDSDYAVEMAAAAFGVADLEEDSQVEDILNSELFSNLENFLWNLFIEKLTNR